MTMRHQLCTLAAARAAIDAADPIPRVDVVSLHAGRHYAFRHWLASIQGLDYPRDRLRLFCYSHSRDPGFNALLAGAALDLQAQGLDTRLTLDPTLAVSTNALRELAPGDEFPSDHAEVIPQLYLRAIAPTSHDLFLVEDDMGIPPDALRRLQSACRTTRPATPSAWSKTVTAPTTSAGACTTTT
jgi:hypothetical protein